MFPNSPNEIKIALIEEKLNMYETVLRKIETAIEKIGETSQNITKMLAIHEERIDNIVKSEEDILRIIEDIKVNNIKDQKEVLGKVEGTDKTVADLAKFKWQAVAVGGMAIILLGWAIPFIDNFAERPYDGGNHPPASVRKSNESY